VTIFALCADPKFDAPTPDLQFQRAKMFCCMLISSCVCGKNLNMHDMAFITWTGSASTGHFHLLMRISEVLLRVTTTGVTADLIAALWPFGDKSTSFCTALVLCCEVAFWFWLLKKQLVGSAALEKIDALGAGMVLTFVDPFYFGNEWKHLSFKRANRVYFTCRLMQPPIVLILVFFAHQFGCDVYKSMLPLIIVVMAFSWCAFGVCSSIVSVRCEAYGVMNHTHGTSIHLAKSIVELCRSFNFFESSCPAPIVGKLRQLANDYIEHAHHHHHHHHQHRRNSRRHSTESRSSHHHRHSNASHAGSLAEPLLEPGDKQSETESDSDEDESGSGSDSDEESYSSSSSSSMSSLESKQTEENPGDEDKDEEQKVAEITKKDATGDGAGNLLDGIEGISLTVKPPAYALPSLPMQPRTVQPPAQALPTGALSSSRQNSSMILPEEFAVPLTVRHGEGGIRPWQTGKSERTGVDVSIEENPEEGSKRGDGTPARVQIV